MSLKNTNMFGKTFSKLLGSEKTNQGSGEGLRVAASSPRAGPGHRWAVTACPAHTALRTRSY